MKIFSIFALIVSALCYVESDLYNTAFRSNRSNPRVCVIGAGIAGLASARYLKEEGIPFTVLEATQYIGGTWRYDPRVGEDENGLPIFTSMYKNLRTNLPRQTMEFSGFPTPDHLPSFPYQEDYYDYIKSFAKHFDLEKHVKFLHYVTSVRREGHAWKVTHTNVITRDVFTEEYDFVFLCSGHFSKPNLPKIPGAEKFNGTMIHSHDYREPAPYANRRVLVVGAGPSGMDIGLTIAAVSTTMFHSHHSRAPFNTPFPKNLIIKPDVKEFTETGVMFVDGSFEEIDDVIFCTGFEYPYPYLDETSGLILNPHYVIPLYRYMINVHQPSMVFMGLTVRCCIVAAIDAQARYATALVKGNFTLPPTEDMMTEWQQRVQIIQNKNRPMADIHVLSEKEDEYYEALSKESGILRVPPVLYKVRSLDFKAKLENLYTYRNYVYTIIDDHTFTRHYVDDEKKRTVK